MRPHLLAAVSLAIGEHEYAFDVEAEFTGQF